MVNFIIGGIVLILFVLASIKTIKDRKKGGCGCGCSSCSNASKCHTNQQTKHIENN